MPKISAVEYLYKGYHNFYRKYYGMDRELSSFKDPVEQIIKTEKNIKSKESFILEYGCGTGFNLEYLHNIGYINLFGIEQNSEVYSDIDIDKSIKILNGNLSENNSLIDDIKFDFIFTRSVLQQKIGIGKIQGDFNTDGDIIKILSSFSNILNTGGIVFLNEGTSTRNWNDIIIKSGFELIDSGNNFFKLKIKI
jgi:SAM-dependent methyltransferase